MSNEPPTYATLNLDPYLFNYLKDHLAVCIKVETPPVEGAKKRVAVKLLLTDPEGVERVIDWDAVNVEALQ